MLSTIYLTKNLSEMGNLKVYKKIRGVFGMVGSSTGFKATVISHRRWGFGEAS